MTYNYAKPTKILTSLIATLVVFSGISYAFADNNDDFVSVTADTIKNDPVLAKILENIEKSRQEFSEVQQKTDQDQFIDERRTIAKNILEQELEQMFKDNKDYTSLAAFNNFLKTVSDDNTKTIFQGLFDYQQNKIDSAKTVMSDVLRNGGSLQDARNAYHDALQIPRSDMIQLVNALNVESGFSDPKIQSHFDENGKLPRYETEQESVISFVDLTTSAKNVNASPTQTEDSIETVKSEPKDIEASDDASSNNVSNTSENTLIQKLLDEIQFLKNKITELEKNQNPVIRQAVLEEKNNESIFFADWVSDYVQGYGHWVSPVEDTKSIPVNALNEPNSYNDVNNSLALGRQGQVTLGFSEPVTGKLIIYEASAEKNIREGAITKVSIDGENWITLKDIQHYHDGSYVHEYTYDLSNIGCITHVQLTDKAPSAWGDGFDVDALGATQSCTDPT